MEEALQPVPTKAGRRQAPANERLRGSSNWCFVTRDWWPRAKGAWGEVVNSRLGGSDVRQAKDLREGVFGCVAMIGLTGIFLGFVAR
jgi:hypothetical protein